MRVVSDWGLVGAQALQAQADAFVVVDVLSFSTCVDVACSAGAEVFPFPIKDQQAALEEGARRGALVAGNRSDPEARFSLSAPTLRAIPAGARLVLPSPNGSHISFAVEGKPVFAGCLRNAEAVGQALRAQFAAGCVAVIAAGERWPDGSLRPAIEDLIGAGAVIDALGGDLSPEARIARAAFLSAQADLRNVMMGCCSGVELVDRGFAQDVEIASALNVSRSVPVLQDGAFLDHA